MEIKPRLNREFSSQILGPKFNPKTVEQDRKIRTLLKYAKRRAKEKGLAFDIKAADIPWTPCCPILEVPFEINRGKDLGPSATLDRIDSTRGYVKGNVRVISWQANKLKQDLTLAQLERLVRYVKGEL